LLGAPTSVFNYTGDIMTQHFSWNDGLMGSAMDIAGTDHSPLRVDAGPGTGKTFALMRRVCRLLEEGCDPKRIYIGTFTRTSATDLKNSLTDLNATGADEAQAGTLHGLCFSMLSKAEVLAHTGRIPRPLLKFEERFLLEDLSGEPFGGVRDCSRKLKAFNAAWSRLQSEEPGWPHNSDDQQFHNMLISWFRFHRAMHIGELIGIALQYLKGVSM
jgi:DNA helicase-2/ATP-dependent DNA helicase PcrA